MPKVHGINLSPFVRKLRVALAEKGVDYELVPAMPGMFSEELKAISPANKIPVWEEEDGYTLPDSSCIVAYLERKGAGLSLYPEDPRDYGQTLFWEEYGDTKVAEAVLAPFVERVVNKRFRQVEPDEKRIKQVLTEIAPPVFDTLESRVGHGDGIVGGRFTVADVAICSPFASFHLGGEKVDAARWPKLAAYVAKAHARPSFKAVIEEELAALG